jgi:hypothetical protein
MGVCFEACPVTTSSFPCRVGISFPCQHSNITSALVSQVLNPPRTSGIGCQVHASIGSKRKGSADNTESCSGLTWGFCAGRDLLVDYIGDPYPKEYQEAFRERRVTQLSLAEAQAECEGDATVATTNGMPHALLQEPPTLTSAAWLAQVRGLFTHCPH